MIPKREISKDPRLNDIVLELQEGIPALDGYTGEEGSGTKVIINPFTFSAPYRVGKSIYLARIDSLNLSFFTEGMAKFGETAATNGSWVKYYTTKYIKSMGVVTNLSIDFHSRIDFQEINIAIYDTPQPSLDGGLPLNAFEVKGRLTRSKLENNL